MNRRGAASGVWDSVEDTEHSLCKGPKAERSRRPSAGREAACEVGPRDWISQQGCRTRSGCLSVKDALCLPAASRPFPGKNVAGGPPAPSSASAPAPWSCSSSGPPGSWNKRALGGLVPARGFRKIWKAAWGQARLLPPAATQALGLSPRNKAGQGLTWGGDSGLP